MEKAYLADLNDAQRQAATMTTGNCLVIAGAGSGKTKTLVSRVAYLLENGVSPYEILLLTFTNKAAEEMKTRIVNFVGEAGNNVMASTFHSFAARVLRAVAPDIGLDSDFTIIDDADAGTLLSACRSRQTAALKENGVNTKDFPTVRKLMTVKSYAADWMLDIQLAVAGWSEDHPEDEEIFDAFGGDITSVLEDYEREKSLKSRLDYDDLLVYLAKALADEDVGQALSGRFRYVMCDEYQDTNHIQDVILDRLSAPNGNLMVVGDDNQSIYKFRGAVIENILTFSDRHGDCPVIKLTENYRSSQDILDTCNFMMGYAEEGIEKKLHGQFTLAPPMILRTQDDKQSADFILEKIKQFHEDGTPYKEMAVMARSATTTSYVERLLLQQNIPYKKFGGLKFTERSVVLYLLAMLRVGIHSDDDIAWLRVLEILVGVGPKTAKAIVAGLSAYGMKHLLDLTLSRKKYGPGLAKLYQVLTDGKAMALGARIRFYFESWYMPMMTSYIQFSNMRDDAKEELRNDLNTAHEFAAILCDMANGYRTVQSFLDDLVLDKTREKDVTDFVNVTTIHSAKGLEYETVFLLNPVDGVFPRAIPSTPDDHEELRCMYVAMTRAKRYLYLFWPAAIRMYDGVISGQLSRYLRHDDVLQSVKTIDMRKGGTRYG